MMPYHNLQATAKQKNITVTELIIEHVNRFGTIARAAAELHVTPQAIRYHLSKHNLTVKPTNTIVEMEQAS